MDNTGYEYSYCTGTTVLLYAITVRDRRSTASRNDVRSPCFRNLVRQFFATPLCCGYIVYRHVMVLQVSAYHAYVRELYEYYLYDSRLLLHKSTAVSSRYDSCLLLIMEREFVRYSLTLRRDNTTTW